MGPGEILSLTSDRLNRNVEKQDLTIPATGCLFCKKVTITDLSHSIVKGFKLRRNCPSNGQNQGAGNLLPHGNMQLSYWSCGIGSKCAQSQNGSCACYQKSVSVAVANKKEEGGDIFESDNLDKLIRGRVVIKERELEQCSSRCDRSWRTSEEDINRTLSESESDLERERHLSRKKMEGERVTSPPNDRAENLRADLAWLRSNHPFMKR